MENKHLIGMGSQRAGSTLLYKLLDEASSIYMHPIKELHYFDTKAGIRHNDVLFNFCQNNLDREILRVVNSNDFKFIDKRYKNYLRALNLLSSRAVESLNYVDLFRPCVMGNVLGEVTPEYMLLSVDQLTEIKSSLVNVKPVICCRNPVDRFISAYKLLKTYGKEGSTFDTVLASKEIISLIEENGTWSKHQYLFNDYELAIKNIISVFGEVFVIKFEDIINPSRTFTDKLSEYLDTEVSHSKAKDVTANKVNSLGEMALLTPEVHEYLQHEFDLYSQYYEKLTSGVMYE